jgi:hypothetical protein
VDKETRSGEKFDQEIYFRVPRPSGELLTLGYFGVIDKYAAEAKADLAKEAARQIPMQPNPVIKFRDINNSSSTVVGYGNTING